MTSYFQIPAAATLVVALVAAITDLRARRIPNALTFGAAAAALVFALVSAGPWGAALSVGGWMTGAALFFPFFALGGMGAGDVKLLAALGAWLGPVDAVWLAIFASMAGGLLAVVVSLYHGYLRQALVNLWVTLMHWRTAGPEPVAGMTLRDTRGPRLAYAIPIAIGLICTLWRG
jgi:prepilin peptidase CpaA